MYFLCVNVTIFFLSYMVKTMNFYVDPAFSVLAET